MYYLKARYYTATLGRFLTRDKFIEVKNKQLQINLYMYSKNNPISYFDPSGYFTIPRWVAAAAIDAIILGIAAWAPASWLAAMAPLKAMTGAAVKAWLKTTFRSRALRFLNVITRAALRYKAVGKWALKVGTTAVVNSIVTHLANNLDMALSIGGFAAGLLDYVTDKKVDRKITIKF